MRKTLSTSLGGVILLLLTLHFLHPRSFRTPSSTKQPETPPAVTAEPRGVLRSIPGYMRFYFEEEEPGVEGVKISPEKIEEYFTINPPLKAEGGWESSRTFVLHFLDPPQANTKYVIKMKKIPLTSRDIPLKEPLVFVFETPPYKLVSVVTAHTKGEYATIKATFNLPILSNAEVYRDYLVIKNEQGKKIRITHIEVEKPYPPYSLYITLPIGRKPGIYTLTVKRGCPGVYGKLLKDHSMEFSVGMQEVEMIVKNMRVYETEEGFSLLIQFTDRKERPCRVTEEDFLSHFEISPEIKVKVVSTWDGVSVWGPFLPEHKYTITLRGGLKSVDGKILSEDFTREINIPERSKKVEFVYRGRYIGKGKGIRIPLKTINVEKIMLTIWYMPPQNILFWWKNGGMDYNFYSYSERIAKEEIEVKGEITWIDLSKYINTSLPGIYHLCASSPGYYKEDKINIVISDISLLAKWKNDLIYIWAVNSQTLEPENGVEIEVRSSKNFLVGKGITGKDGLCVIKTDGKRGAYLIFAHKKQEWTYLHLPSSRIPYDPYPTDGDIPGRPYLVYLYPERDLYRPGEKVNFAVLVRDAFTFEGLSLPVRVVVRNPKGTKIAELTEETDLTGLVSFSFATAPSSPTGKYAISVYIGDTQYLTEFVFVEAFVPERMSVNVEVPEKVDLYKGFPVKVQARYLFGAIPSGEKVYVRAVAKEIPFRPKRFSDYKFGIRRRYYEKRPMIESERISGTLDEEGRATLTCRFLKREDFQEPVRLTLYVDVTEGGSGRVTKKRIEKIIHIKPFYIGLKKKKEESDRIVIEGVVLNPDGSLYTGELTLCTRMYKRVYRYTYSYSGRYGWESHWEDVPVTPLQKVAVKDGKFTFSFDKRGINYWWCLVIEVWDEKTNARTRMRSGWWWEYRREKIPSPEVLPVVLSRNPAEPGDEVEAEVLLPFEGKILWTVELDTVYIQEWREARGEKATWKFRVPRGAPNVYVTAMLIRSGENYLIARSYGIERLKIRPSASRLQLTIEAPDRAKPGDEITIRVRGNEEYNATIAVVDEGILQITGFKTPDVYEGILRVRRLLLSFAESFGWIIRKTLEGGGYAPPEEERMEARFTRIVSYWSGILKSEDKEVVYRVKLPPYNGKLRIMVSGAGIKRMGSAEKDVIVTSDVVVMPTLPRFLYSKDRFSFPITLLNTTSSRKKARISIKAEGIRLSKIPSSLSLAPEEKKTIWIEATAENDIGPANIILNVRSGSETYLDTFIIPIYPSVPYITEGTFFHLRNGKGKDLSSLFADWYAYSHRTTIILSSTPAGIGLGHLKYAIRYPYGCAEQLSTSTLLLLRLRPLIPYIDPEIDEAKYSDMVYSGIYKLISLQTPSGGFGFWPGNLYPAEWTSIYVTFVLMEAKSAGFAVSDGVIKSAVNYIKTLLEKYTFSYYVLARGGILQKDRELVDRLLTSAEKEEMEDVSLLWIAGALEEIGKHEDAEKVLRKALKKRPYSGRRYSRDFYSPLKNLALRLYHSCHIIPEDRICDSLAHRIVDALKKSSYWYSTQELAWSLTALGVYMETHPSSPITRAVITMGRKRYSPRKKDLAFFWHLKNAPEKLPVKLSWRGKDAFVWVEQTGFSKKTKLFERKVEGIAVDVFFYNLQGKPVDSLKLGEMGVVKVFIEPSRNLDNVAIEVPIPAGLEIENPRLRPEDLPGWVKKTWTPDYVDIKDEKLILFGRIFHKHYYYFLVRAVTPGRFFRPPVHGIAMYEPTIYGSSDAGRFKITK
ncbi:hypothetical protein DRQ18_00175 [bacterium]|nr:MAG: hypothetical protein DRQ18_00175 [bacterium]